MRVIVADDTLPFARGLADMLRELGVDVTAIVGDPDELIDAVDRDPPDVVIVDVSMPPTFTDEGLQAAEILYDRHPRVGVLVVSAYDEDGWPGRLLRRRVRGVGYLRKRKLDDIASVREALNRIRSGGIAIDQEITERMLRNRSVRTNMALLTAQQRAVLAAMARGLSNAGIGALLDISDRTVEKHISKIFETLGLEKSDDANLRVRAVVLWLEHERSGRSNGGNHADTDG